jgi:predicted RND superfamily exporter protein
MTTTSRSPPADERDPDLAPFDPASGNLPERLIFNHRPWALLACLLATAFLALQMRVLTVSASFDKMLPHSHPYIQNYLHERHHLRGLGDSVRVVVENPSGDVFDPRFLATFARINDEIYLIPGVDRAWMKSIWSPAVRWTEVTEEGFNDGPVVPNNFDYSAGSVESLRINVARSGIVGDLVASDYKSGMIVVPLLAKDAQGRPIDYHAVASAVEHVRAKYVGQGDHSARVYVIGFAKLVGDLIDGLSEVMAFFLAAAVVAGLVIFLYTRCIRSTSLVVACSLLAVVWQLGLMVSLGYGLDPFSILVPFLVFAIGVSHGAQKMNGIMQDIGRGIDTWIAARYTFRRLFLAGLTALIADAVGFAALVVIDIPVIRELAMAASIGMAVLIFTNLILLPVLLSYVGVSSSAARRSLAETSEERGHRGFGRVWEGLDMLTRPRMAIAAVAASVLLGVAGYLVSLGLKVGDLDPGAPELRRDSRYNIDNAYITSHYAISSDVFAVMVKTPRDECSTVENLTEVDRLSWRLAQLNGVQRVVSLADTMRLYLSGAFEGNPKWFTLSDDQRLIDPQYSNAVSWNSELLDTDCTLLPVVAYLKDHKAETLARVLKEVETFAAEHDTDKRKFLPAAGNAGVDAVTNIVVAEASRRMLAYVYAAVILLCAVTFRSWRAVIAAVVPLALTSILAEALMVKLDIGVKVATLPAVALGVGIGVDYALYLLSVQLAQQREGVSLAAAYRSAVAFTGRVVALVGVTLAAGVITWVWSPIKFQADMGVMLTFMFLWNMLGALILIPALSCFLLRDLGNKSQEARQLAVTTQSE